MERSSVCQSYLTSTRMRYSYQEEEAADQVLCSATEQVEGDFQILW